jgi:hypothetical protein
MTRDLSVSDKINGYTYGTAQVASSPIDLHELRKLEQAVGLTVDDKQQLRQAGEILADQAIEMVETWRGIIGECPHLARYSAHPDGNPNPRYSAASHPRFARWIIDLCTRRYDQDWLDYQHEIALRHSRAKKNQTDDADSADHIPLRYVLGFTPVILLTAKDFLARKGHPADAVERMHAAWVKAVMLHVTIWTRAYVSDDDW